MSGRRRPPPWLWLTAAAAVVALAVWAIGRAGGDQTDSASSSPAGSSTPTADDPPSSLADATAQTAGGPDPTPPTSDGLDRVISTGAAVTVGGPSDALSAPAGDGAPVLGRRTGWSLLTGSAYGGVVSRLDLDTGERSAVTGVEGGPLAVVDEALILLRTVGNRLTLRILPLDQLTAAGIEIEVSDGVQTSVWPVTPGGGGRLWVYTSIGDMPAWRLIRLEDGALLDEVPTFSLFEIPPIVGAGPDVATSRSGGVYRREGGRYRLVGQGAPLAAHQGDVLIRNCSAPATCTMQWLDLETGLPVDRPLPPTDPDIYWGGFEPSGRFLLGTRLESRFALSGGEILVHDLESGSTVVAGGDGLGEDGFAASPDGRLLAVGAGDGVRLYDVDRDVWVDVGGFGDMGAPMVFVSNGDAP